VIICFECPYCGEDQEYNMDDIHFKTIVRCNGCGIQLGINTRLGVLEIEIIN